MMPNLSIKNVPPRLVENLRRRAARHHRSMQGELMELIAAAVEEPVAARPAAELREANESGRSGGKSIEQIASEHRVVWKEPITKGPRASDVLRAERDAR